MCSTSRAIFLALLALFACGCGEKSPPVVTAALEGDSLVVTVDPPTPIAHLALLDPVSHKALLEWRDLPASAGPTRLAVPELPANALLVWVLPLDGVRTELALPPKAPAPPIEVTVGLVGHPGISVWDPGSTVVLVVPPGAVQLALEILPHEAGDLSITLTGDPIAVRLLNESREVTGDERVVHSIPLTVPEGGHIGMRLSLRLMYPPGSAATMLTGDAIFELRAADPATLRDSLTITDTLFPAPREGAPKDPLQQGLIQTPNSFWNTVARAIGQRPQHLAADVPVGEAEVTIASTAEGSLPLILAGTVFPKGGTEPASAFQPSSWMASGASGSQVSRYVEVKPGETRARLPVYVRPEVLAGDYELRIEGTMVGTDTTLISASVPLQVRTSSGLLTWTLLALILIATTSFAVWALRYSALMAAFSAHDLMRIAFLSALWVGGGLVTRLTNLALTAILGPFNVFVGEFLGEVYSAAITVIIVALRPRPGTFALAYTISHLLRSLLAGELHLVDYLIVGSTVGLTETVLYVSGLTRARSLFERYPTHPLLVSVITALCLGVVGAILTWAQYAIGMSLYRLMYASWYIIATIAITGFLYPMLGVLAGLPLAMSLRKIDA